MMTDLTKHLVQQVKHAPSRNQVFCIQGGSSKDFYGRRPEGLPLKLSEHTGIVGYDPDELVITVRSGTRLAEIDAVLAENRQVLAFDPPHFSQASTIGGTVACNLSGPARPWAGACRDMVLGLKLIDGRGELLNFGGKVMKNVAGYDVSRLQCGGLGCFGIITEVSLKVMPAKFCSLSLVAPIDDADIAIRLMNRLSACGIALTGAAWSGAALHVRLEGSATGVSSAAARLREIAHDLTFSETASDYWNDLRDQSIDFFGGGEPIWRFSVKSTAPHFLPGADWLVDWAGSQRWLKGDFTSRQLEAEARKASGSVSCFRNGDRSDEVFQLSDPVTQGLLANLKAAFDPYNLFNPGRLYSQL